MAIASSPLCGHADCATSTEMADACLARLIRSDPIYPAGNGRATLTRQYGAARDSAPWSVAVGDSVVALDGQGWIWRLRVEAAREKEIDATVLDERRPSGMPPITDNGYITLSAMSGHAHVRGWRRGDIVQVHGRTWKVGSCKGDKHGTSETYNLTEVPVEAYATRPGRVRMSSGGAAQAAIGSAIRVGDEWLHAKKVSTTSFRGALGRGTTWWVEGTFVSAERAEKLNDVHAPTLRSTLSAVHGERIASSMPADATVLVASSSQSMAATGERIAIVDGVLWHERVGDPDMADVWRHYVVRITDAGLVARCRRFIAVLKRRGS